MTLEVFGAKLGISRQAAHALERAEASESISVRRLRAAAEAVNCELVLFLRPRQPLESHIRERAMIVARELVARTGHSMSLEDQTITDSHLLRLLEECVEDLVSSGDQRIWQWK